MKTIIIAFIKISYYSILKKIWYRKPKVVLKMRLEGLIPEDLEAIRNFLTWRSAHPLIESNVPKASAIDEKSRLELMKATRMLNEYLKWANLPPTVNERMIIGGVLKYNGNGELI